MKDKRAKIICTGSETPLSLGASPLRCYASDQLLLLGSTCTRRVSPQSPTAARRQSISTNGCGLLMLQPTCVHMTGKKKLSMRSRSEDAAEPQVNFLLGGKLAPEALLKRLFDMMSKGNSLLHRWVHVPCLQLAALIWPANLP